MIQTMSHQYFLIKIMEKLLSLHTEDVYRIAKNVWKKSLLSLVRKLSKIIFYNPLCQKRCFIIFPLFILASAKKQLWLPELSCTNDVSDLSDPPGDSFSMELSCIDGNSTLKLPILLSPFSSTFRLQPPVSESERESLYSEMNSLRAECENLKTERQKFDFLSPTQLRLLKPTQKAV